MNMSMSEREIIVKSKEPSLEESGYNWIGYSYRADNEGTIYVYPDYSFKNIQLSANHDETLTRLVKLAFKKKDKQAALCAYDRLVELGYLQLPEGV